jgi:hypothetical protein
MHENPQLTRIHTDNTDKRINGMLSNRLSPERPGALFRLLIISVHQSNQSRSAGSAVRFSAVAKPKRWLEIPSAHVWYTERTRIGMHENPQLTRIHTDTRITRINGMLSNGLSPERPGTLLIAVFDEWVLLDESNQCRSVSISWRDVLSEG